MPKYAKRPPAERRSTGGGVSPLGLSQALLEAVASKAEETDGQQVTFALEDVDPSVLDALELGQGIEFERKGRRLLALAKGRTIGSVPSRVAKRLKPVLADGRYRAFVHDVSDGKVWVTVMW